MPRFLIVSLFCLVGGASAVGKSMAPMTDPVVAAKLEMVRQKVTALSKLEATSGGQVGFYLRRLDEWPQPASLAQAPSPPEPPAALSSDLKAPRPAKQEEKVIEAVKRDPALSFQPTTALIPASTLKLLTTGVALYTLGPDFRFTTRLYHEWETDNIVIRGGGDPTLAREGSEELFAAWTAAIRKDGGDVLGRIVADESEWESQEFPDGWSWQDIGNYYAPALTPLTFQGNEFSFTFIVPEKIGASVEPIGAEPWPQGLEFLSEVRVGKAGTGDQAYFYGGPGTQRYVIRGTLPQGWGSKPIRGALPDPALFCAQEFTWWLRNRDVSVAGEATTSRRLGAAGEATPIFAACGHLHTHRSAPLAEIIIPLNHRSLNLDAECLLKTLGHGKTAEGGKAVAEYLTEHQLPTQSFEQHDGSGLSLSNRISPQTLAEAVAHFATGQYGAEFIASLPTAGESGTLRKMGLGTTAQGRIHAKSGSVDGVKCYAGLADGTDTNRWVFAVMVNHYIGSTKSVNEALEDVFEALAALP